MAEELGTKDVLGQVDARLANLEHDVRDLRTEMGGLRTEMGSLRTDFTGGIAGLRSDMNLRLESQTRWLVSQNRWVVGFVFAGWLALMTSIWLKG